MKRLSKQRWRKIHERNLPLASRWESFIYLRESFFGVTIHGFPSASEHQVRWACGKLAEAVGARRWEGPRPFVGKGYPYNPVSFGEEVK